MAFGFQIQLLKKLSHNASVPINEKKKKDKLQDKQENRQSTEVHLHQTPLPRHLHSHLRLHLGLKQSNNKWKYHVDLNMIGITKKKQMNKGGKFLKKVWCNVSGGGEERGGGHNEIIAFYQLTLKCKLVTVETFLKLTFRPLPLRQGEWRGANAKDFSFRNSLR